MSNFGERRQGTGKILKWRHFSKGVRFSGSVSTVKQSCKLTSAVTWWRKRKLSWKGAPDSLVIHEGKVVIQKSDISFQQNSPSLGFVCFSLPWLWPKVYLLSATSIRSDTKFLEVETTVWKYWDERVIYSYLERTHQLPRDGGSSTNKRSFLNKF